VQLHRTTQSQEMNNSFTRELVSHDLILEDLKEEEKESTSISSNEIDVYNLSQNVILLVFGSFFLSESVFSFQLNESNGNESSISPSHQFDYLNDSSLQNKTKQNKGRSHQMKARQSNEKR
jgi:hypothetical protein